MQEEPTRARHPPGQGKDKVYHGETSRTLHTRATQHRDDYLSNFTSNRTAKGSWMWVHILEENGHGVSLAVTTRRTSPTGFLAASGTASVGKWTKRLDWRWSSFWESSETEGGCRRNGSTSLN